jgi:hypothetical protein
MSDPTLTAEWLRYVYDPAIRRDMSGVIVLSTPKVVDGKKAWKSKCFQLDQTDAAGAMAVNGSDAGLNMYYRVHLLGAPVAEYKRGGGTATRLVTHITSDVDIAGPGHKPPEGKILPTFDQAVKLIDDTLPPSAIIASGGGLYPVWRLTEPYEINGPDDIERFKMIGRRLDAALGRHGYHVDATALDLARVIRPPGVDNRKPDRDVRPVTIHRHWTDGAGDYRISDLDKYLPAIEHRKVKKLAPTGNDGDAPWAVFASKYSITDVLAADDRHQWEDVGTRGGMPAWRYVGSSSDYSIKQSDTGVIIVWSGTIADELGIEPGEGLDLWGIACGLAGVNPTDAAKGKAL